MIMDVTLKDYMGLNSRESISVIKKMIDEVKSVNGTFISIWHNESLYFRGKWSGWDTVYENMIKYNVQFQNEIYFVISLYPYSQVLY